MTSAGTERLMQTKSGLKKRNKKMARLDAVKPKNDLVFKKILEKKSRLKAFIADVLDVERESVNSVEILNTEVLPNETAGKFCRLDVKAKIDGKIIDVEIQRNDRNDFRERTLYYWARLYSSSLNKGQEYIELPQTIIISVVDYNLFPTSDFYSNFVIKEKNRNELLTDKLSMYFFELKKLPKGKEPATKLENWLKFFGAESDEEIEALTSVEDGELISAIDEFRILSSDDKFVQEIVRREEMYIDERMALTAEHKAGREEGKIEGKIEKAIETAQELLKMGLSAEQISTATKLTIAEIEEIEKMSLEQ
jgi:predicted transposase/invertase (TIGR01784 family)